MHLHHRHAESCGPSLLRFSCAASWSGVFGDEVEASSSFGSIGIIRKAKKIIPNVRTKFFRKRESFWIIFQKNGVFIQNTEDLFSQLDKQFDRAEEAFEKLSKTSNMPRRINYFFNQKTFIKKP
jgi:transcription-repair coupling factor (superfamily II helicase)